MRDRLIGDDTGARADRQQTIGDSRHLAPDDPVRFFFVTPQLQHIPEDGQPPLRGGLGQDTKRRQGRNRGGVITVIDDRRAVEPGTTSKRVASCG